MRIRGFLAVFILVVVFVFILYTVKTGKQEKIREDIEAFSRVKVKTTKTNMTTLGRSVSAFMAESGYAPESLDEIRSMLVPLATARWDAWETEIKYEKLSDSAFRLTSAGRDRTFGTDDDIVQEF